MPDREVRYLEAERPEVREDGDSPKIAGYAAVFNQETVIGGMFREVIKPGAFKKPIRDGQDVRALVNHNPDNVLGRTAAGTLRLKEDKRGLAIENDPPDTQLGHDTMESIRRGDIDQMSFAFIATDEKWHEKKGEMPLREIRSVDLYDVSVVTFPAYEGTNVGLRSAEAVYQEHIRSLEGQEPADEEPQDTAAQERADALRIVELLRI